MDPPRKKLNRTFSNWRLPPSLTESGANQQTTMDNLLVGNAVSSCFETFVTSLNRYGNTLPRWQSNQLLTAIIDNAVNRVLDGMNIVTPAEGSASFSDGKVEDEAILTAIGEHGLHNKNDETSSSESDDDDEHEEVPISNIAADQTTGSLAVTAREDGGSGSVVFDGVQDCELLDEAISAAIQYKGVSV